MMKLTRFMTLRGLTHSGVTVSGADVALPADATQYLDGTGAFSTPAGGGGAFDGQGTIPGGRLTLTTALPVTTSDVTGAGTLYYTPYLNKKVATYSGSAWVQKTFAEISLALTLTSGKNYDVFLNSAATTLSLSAAWTNDTTRADALSTQDSVTVLSSDHTKLWLGTIRASGSNTTEDSGGTASQTGGKRFVWNAYNRVRRGLAVFDTTDSWAYTSSTLRQANAAAGNKVEYVCGLAAEFVEAQAIGTAFLASNSNFSPAKTGVGVDSITALSGLRGVAYNSSTSAGYFSMLGSYRGIPGLGYHYLAWLEVGTDTTCTFLGDNGGDGTQTGLQASVFA